MATTTTPRIDPATTHAPTLLLAFELGVSQWKLGVTTGVAQRPRQWHVPGCAVQAVFEEVNRAKRRVGLPEDTRVVSGYKAGRDGFWLHRCLRAHSMRILSWTRRVWRSIVVSGERKPTGSMCASFLQWCSAIWPGRRRWGVWSGSQASRMKIAACSTGSRATEGHPLVGASESTLKHTRARSKQPYPSSVSAVHSSDSST
jgi:hypothetical protein